MSNNFMNTAVGFSAPFAPDFSTAASASAYVSAMLKSFNSYINALHLAYSCVVTPSRSLTFPSTLANTSIPGPTMCVSFATVLYPYRALPAAKRDSHASAQSTSPSLTSVDPIIAILRALSRSMCTMDACVTAAHDSHLSIALDANSSSSLCRRWIVRSARASVASVASAAIGDARARRLRERREGIFADARDGRERAPNAAVCGTFDESD